MKCKYISGVTQARGTCNLFARMCSYEVSRKKARSKSMGEQQKLKHKVMKETKVCVFNYVAKY